MLQRELGRDIQVEREIARGHYFVVFEGVERAARRRVAIKVVPPQLATEHPTRAARVLRAARVAAGFGHPHVVPVLRVAAGDRLAWFVTPFEPGALQQLLERECELSAERSVQLIGETAAALAAAHARRLLHGDLSPAVVMLDERGAARVRDFGIAPAAEVRGKSGGPPAYDPHYLAPERTRGAGPTESSDQYALGAIAYQMLAGTRPFFGATDEMVRRQHVELPVPSLLATRPDLSPVVARAVERALAKEPGARYPSVDAFARALAGEAPQPGRMPLIRDRLARTAAPAASAAAPPARTAPSPRPRDLELPPLGPRELVRPRPAADLTTQRRSGMPPIAAFGVVAAGLIGLWLYIANTGRSDAALPVVSLQAEPAPSQTTFGAATPPLVDSMAAEAPPAIEQPAAPPPSRAAPRPRTPPRRSARAAPSPPLAQLPAPRGEQPTVGYLTVGSVPQGAIFVNGRLMPSNPVVALPVTAGPVRLRFEASDGSGRLLEREMLINLGPGDSLNLGRVRLDRP